MKKFSITLIILLLCAFLVFLSCGKSYVKVLKVYSPYKIAADINKNGDIDDNEEFLVSGIETFVPKIDDEQKKYAKSLGISEEDAIAAGYFAEKFAQEFLEGKTCKLKLDLNIITEIICENQNYIEVFNTSPFGMKNGKPLNQELFNAELKKIHSHNYRIYNNKNGRCHRMNCKFGQQSQEFSVLSESQIPQDAVKCKYCLGEHPAKVPPQVFKKFILSKGDIKFYLTDLTMVLKPNNYCDTECCRAILNGINRAQNTIDMALYGYAEIPDITKAIRKAIERGVKIRLVYDIDSKGLNFYPETFMLANLITDNASDIGEKSFQSAIMHNKFFIIDGKTVISGSANLATTDMSGYNSNAVVIINSKEVADVYQREFDQMYSGKFHNLKEKIAGKENIRIGNSVVSVYFSPKDNVINTVIIPLVDNAKSYIYLPVFVITHNKLAQSLINAKARGVDVRIILDATNASNKSSIHGYLRQKGILVKTENYAGKMHSKSMIIDGKYTIVGSMNFSHSGETKNDENILVIENPEIANMYKEFFSYVWKKIPDKYLTRNVRSESKESWGSCTDGIDNNFDGKIDGDDDGCK